MRERVELPQGQNGGRITQSRDLDTLQAALKAVHRNATTCPQIDQLAVSECHPLVPAYFDGRYIWAGLTKRGEGVDDHVLEVELNVVLVSTSRTVRRESPARNTSEGRQNVVDNDVQETCSTHDHEHFGIQLPALLQSTSEV